MNLRLTRQVALIEARLCVLIQCSDALTELSDMQTLRELRASLQEYINRKHAVEEIPADPLSYAIKEIEQIASTVSATQELYNRCIAFGGEVEDPSQHSLSEAELIRISESLDEERNRATADLESMRGRYRPVDWQEDSQLDIVLSAISKMLQVSTDVTLPSARDLFLLTHYQGKLYETLQDHWVKIEVECPKLLQLHENQVEVLEEAMACAKRGDFIQAKATVGSLKQVFNDLSFNDVLLEASEWSKPLEELKQAYKDLKKRALFPPLPYVFPAFLSRRRWKADESVRNQAIANLLRTVETFRLDVDKQPENDFRTEAERVIGELQHDCNLLRIQMEDLFTPLLSRARVELAVIGTICLAVALFAAVVTGMRYRDWRNDQAQWQTAVGHAKSAGDKYEDAASAYQKYLTDLPGGRHVNEAKQFIQVILPQKIDDRDWENALDEVNKGGQTSELALSSVKAYEAGHATGSHIGEARGLIAKLVSQISESREWQQTLDGVRQCGEDVTGLAKASAQLKTYLKQRRPPEYSPKAEVLLAETNRKLAETRRKADGAAWSQVLNGLKENADDADRCVEILDAYTQANPQGAFLKEAEEKREPLASAAYAGAMRRGLLASNRADWTEAVKSYKRALVLVPKDAEAARRFAKLEVSMYGSFLDSGGPYEFTAPNDESRLVRLQISTSRDWGWGYDSAYYHHDFYLSDNGQSFTPENISYDIVTLPSVGVVLRVRVIHRDYYLKNVDYDKVYIFKEVDGVVRLSAIE